MIWIGIKNNKIIDMCDPLYCRNKDNGLSDKDYILTEESDLVIGDSWDFEKNESLKDSPQRIPEEPKKSELELKVIELETRIKALEDKIIASKV